MMTDSDLIIPAALPWPRRFRDLQYGGEIVHRNDHCLVYSYPRLKSMVMKVSDCKGSPELFRLAENECCTLLALRGRPGVLWVYDYEIDNENETVWLLTEQVNPLTRYLEDYLLGVPDVCEIGAGICDALIEIRNAGYRHLDISPGNVYFDPAGHSLKLGDFNAARRIGEAEKLPFALGTPAYMAPERHQDFVGSEVSEICSIGLLLYAICNGGLPPFRPEEPSDEAAIRRRMTGEELPLPQYALKYPERLAPLVPVLKKACAYRPEDRFQTFEELRDALSAAGFAAYRMHGRPMISASYGSKDGTLLTPFDDLPVSKLETSQLLREV